MPAGIFWFYLTAASIILIENKNHPMKNNTQPALPLLAYPLRAVIPKTFKKETTTEQSPYLKSILAGKTRMSNNVRVFQIARPYVKKPEPLLKPEETIVPNDIELSEKEWFNNYE